MLYLVVLNRVVLLFLRLVLELRRLILRKLHHHEALCDSVQLILQQYHAFKVDLFQAHRNNMSDDVYEV